MKMKKLTATGLILCTALMFSACKSNVTDKQITMNFGGSDRQVVYTGEFDNDKPNGHGKVTGTNSQNLNWVYEGEMKDGQFNGKGKTTWANGTINEGIYVNNIFTEGKILSNNTLLYEGKLKDGLPDKEPIAMNNKNSIADWDYTVTSAQRSNSAGNLQAKGIYLIVNLTVKNNGTAPRQFASGANKYAVVDEKGNRYNMDDKALLEYRLHTQSSGDWYLTEFNPNMGGNIILIFDVPKDINSFTLWPIQNVWQSTPSKIDL